MPCDNSGQAEEYNNIWAEVIAICNSHEHNFVIIGGDMNTDLSRINSAQTNSLKHICETEGLKCINQHPSCQIGYTYESKSNGHKSCLDHFIITDNMFDSVNSCTVSHDFDNLSDHSVVSMSLCVDTFVGYERINVDHISKPLWSKASDNQVSQYKSQLSKLVNDITIPSEAIECTDFMCMKHCNDIQKYHDDLISCCLKASEASIPMSKPAKLCHKVPGWNDHVKSHRDTAMFWHGMWKDNGSPNSGIIFDIRRKTRYQYHNAIRAVKRNKLSWNATKVAEGFVDNCNIHFWSEIKKLKGNTCSRTNSVDGISGACNIANTFHEKYKHLYNIVSYDENEMSSLKCQAMNDILLQDQCGNDLLIGDVLYGIRQLKHGKTDGNTGHMTDHIIVGSDILSKHLHYLFNCMLNHGYAPHDFSLSTLIPIPKNTRKSLNDSNNYRAIALSSILSKALDHIILFKYQESLCTSDLQYGFKKHHSTTQCTFIVNEVIEYYLKNGSNVNIVLLDASKAFDRVNYIKLFKLLFKRKLSPLVIRFLLSLYTKQNVRVRWGLEMSNICSVSNGVKQGGVMSPILFIIYLDELLNRLKESGFGCHIGNTFCGAFGYADDVTLIAPTLYSTNMLLDICTTFADEYDVIFNSGKTKHIFLAPNDINPPVITFNGDVIERVHCDKHLGNIIGHHHITENVNRCIQEFTMKVNMVCMHFKHIPHDIIYSLFKTYCMPVYGCQLWDFSHTSVNRFYVTWRKAIRRILSLPYSTHCDLLAYICNDIPLMDQLLKRVINFIKSARNSKNVITNLCYNLALSGSCSPMSNNITFLSDYFRMLRTNVHKINVYEYDVVKRYDSEVAIRASVIRDMLHVLHNNKYGDNFIFNTDEIKFLLNELCTN